MIGEQQFHTAMKRINHVVLKTFARALTVVLLAAALPFSSSSQTINVDFNDTDGSVGTYSGTAAAPDSGTTWNGFAVGPEAGAPLIASNFMVSPLS